MLITPPPKDTPSQGSVALKDPPSADLRPTSEGQKDPASPTPAPKDPPAPTEPDDPEPDPIEDSPGASAKG
jgi:hypothetical protein